MKPVPRDIGSRPERDAPSPFAMLGISENATAEELDTAYQNEMNGLLALAPATDAERALLERKRAMLTDAYERSARSLKSGDPVHALPAAYARARRLNTRSTLYSIEIPSLIWLLTHFCDLIGCERCVLFNDPQSKVSEKCYYGVNSPAPTCRIIDTVIALLAGALAVIWLLKRIITGIIDARKNARYERALAAARSLEARRQRLVHLSVNVTPFLDHLAAMRSTDAADRAYDQGKIEFDKKVAVIQQEYAAFNADLLALYNGEFGRSLISMPEFQKLFHDEHKL